MKKVASVIALLLIALAVFAGTALAGDVARYQYHGNTYTPATDATHTSPAGFVPTVNLPADAHYYASRPPLPAVQVYARNLRYVVWVPLDTALTDGWYSGQDSGVPTWALVLILGGGTLTAGVGLGIIWDRRGRPKPRRLKRS